MAFDFTEIVIFLFYLSILIEIIVFPVPSVASSYQLLTEKKSLPEGFLYTRIQQLNTFQKIILLAIPSALSVIAYCTPLILLGISKLFPVLMNKTEKLGFVLVSIVLLLLGRMIAFYSVIRIRINNRQLGNSFELKTGSIFSISRNPILMGMYISFIGMLILFPYWFVFIAFGYYFVHMHFRILIEESFLKFKFGDKYVNYMQQTKRYF